MASYPWTKYLEISTNIAVLLVAMALLAALISARFTGPEQLSFEPGIKQGQAMPRLATVDYGAESRTMLLSLSTKCGYCQDSLPFYKRLIEEHRKSADSPSLVALFPNSEMEVNEYKRQNQLDVKSVANVNPSSLNLKGTPTLILVDAEGKVSDVWVGKLSTNDEQQVISRLQHR